MPGLVNPYRFGTVVPPASFATKVAALSPSAWYRLNEASGSTTFADSSGNGHGGTLVSGLTFGATGLVAGDSDTAATADSACNAEVAYGSWMDATSALSVFIVASTSVTTGTPMLLSRDDQQSPAKRIWQFRLNAGVLEWVKIASGVVVASNPNGSTADGNPHDYGATYDGSNIRLYVDGVKVKTQAATGSLGTLAGRLFIGNARNSAGLAATTWVGVLDEPIYKAGAVWADSDFAALHAARI